MVVFDLVVGILSIVLAVFAVWLSVALFRMSERAAEGMREAHRSIDTSLAKLDGLFNSLYSDAWSLVRESYSSMQSQLSTPRVAPPGEPPLTSTGHSIQRHDTRSIPYPPLSAPDADLEEFILNAFKTLSESGMPVHAGDLADAAEHGGYGAVEAINALHDLAFVRRLLDMEDDKFEPAAVVTGRDGAPSEYPGVSM